MIDGHGAALGEGDAVADLNTVFHNFDDVGHIVILLQGSEDLLDSFHVAVQLVTQRLKLLDAFFVVAELVPDFIQVGAGNQ